MGLFKGALALRRYRVMQKPPEYWREQYDKAVRAHALVPIDRAGIGVQSAGWCSVYDAQVLDFDAEYVEGRILLSLRMDALKPDPAEVKKQVKLAAQRLEAERYAPLSKATLRDVKALVIIDMRKTTPIKTRTVDAVWNLETQRLYVLSHSKKANECFIRLFAQTFNIPLDLEGPGFWAEQYARGMVNELNEVAAKYQCGSRRMNAQAQSGSTRSGSRCSALVSPRWSCSGASAGCARASWPLRRTRPRRWTTRRPTRRCPPTTQGSPIAASSGASS